MYIIIILCIIFYIYYLIKTKDIILNIKINYVMKQLEKYKMYNKDAYNKAIINLQKYIKLYKHIKISNNVGFAFDNLLLYKNKIINNLETINLVIENYKIDEYSSYVNMLDKILNDYNYEIIIKNNRDNKNNLNKFSKIIDETNIKPYNYYFRENIEI